MRWRVGKSKFNYFSNFDGMTFSSHFKFEGERVYGCALDWKGGDAV